MFDAYSNLPPKSSPLTDWVIRFGPRPGATASNLSGSSGAGFAKGTEVDTSSGHLAGLAGRAVHRERGRRRVAVLPGAHEAEGGAAAWGDVGVVLQVARRHRRPA